jgi:hypothetical protein
MVNEGICYSEEEHSEGFIGTQLLLEIPVDLWHLISHIGGLFSIFQFVRNCLFCLQEFI